jgi:hypothetical protein
MKAIVHPTQACGLTADPSMKTQGWMSDSIEQLVEALRYEMQQYGETLALLDFQNEPRFPRSSVHLILNPSTRLERQCATLETAREQREIVQADLASKLGKPEKNTLPGDIVSIVLNDYKPLLRALLEETDELFCRARKKVRLNQLQRTYDLMLCVIGGISGECPAVVASHPGSAKYVHFSASQPCVK